MFSFLNGKRLLRFRSLLFSKNAFSFALPDQVLGGVVGGTAAICASEKDEVSRQNEKCSLSFYRDQQVGARGEIEVVFPQRRKASSGFQPHKK